MLFPDQTAMADEDLPICVWEKGTVRNLVEEEFEMALLRQIEERCLRVDAAQEKRLHDAIVPQIFFFVAHQCPWTLKEEAARSFHPRHRQVIQHEIERLLRCAFGQSLQHAACTGTFRHLLMVFRTLPGKVRDFLSP